MQIPGAEILAGGILPFIIDITNTKITNSKLRYVVSLLICFLIALAMNYNELDWNNVFESGAIIFTAAQTTYKTYWEKSDLRDMSKKMMNLG